MIVRLFLALLLGMLISLALFWLMQYMVSPDIQAFNETSRIKMVDFVRLKREENRPETRKRTPPEPKPPEPRPATPSMSPNRPLPVAAKAPSMSLPNLDIPVDSGRFQGSFMSGLQVGPATGQPGGEIVPLVRIEPRYPMRAAMRKIEGWVKVEFTITETGTVKDIDIVEAKPSGVFDQAVRQALSKWKFKPKLQNGEPVAQRATQTLEFRLKR